MLRRRARHRHADPARLTSKSRPAGAHARPQASSLSEGDEHLRGVDPVMRGLIDARGPIDPETDRRASRPDPFLALARAIVGQQLSTKAARSIWDRVVETLGEEPSPANILAAAPEDLRGAGLSNSKVEYLTELAQSVESGDLDLARIGDLADEDVIAELIEVKGIGRWTAEMFLIFHLGRPDVVSAGDLGIRRAIQLAYDLEDLPGPTDLERIADPWRPHRTLACLYLWRSLDNTPVEDQQG